MAGKVRLDNSDLWRVNWDNLVREGFTRGQSVNN